MIRIFDILLTITGLVILIPVFLLIALLIKLDSKGTIFFLQERIGKGEVPFKLIKFRSMYPDSAKKGLLTVGRDNRITKVGHYLRKFKLDELPQLFNVLKGEMSLVGPRPEVEKYVKFYSPDQKKLLLVRPGITDPASIYFRNENEVLANASQPEKTYIEDILPKKLELSSSFAHEPTIRKYFKYIFITIIKIIKN